MQHLDILLPFGLPPAEMASDLLRVLKTPALAMLASRSKSLRRAFDGFARALPHETWLARQFGLPGAESGGSLRAAHGARRAFGLAPEAGVWFILHPVHLHVARDHLVLTDHRRLAIPEKESRALFDAARPLFEQTGKQLVYGGADTWFVRADEWRGLHTATPDAACGRNVDIWMPEGDGARDWRKLQNDVQMHWHVHAVNQARETRGLKAVNSLWLWGGSDASDSAGRAAEPASSPAASPYTQRFNVPPWLATPGDAGAAAIADVVAPGSQKSLLVLDALTEAALAGDWPEWLMRLHRLEADWFAPLLDALKDGWIERITLLASHHAELSEFTANAYTLNKFWVKPSLAKFLP